MKQLLILMALLAISTNSFCQIDIAQVEKIDGIYIFTDCSPISEYEVIGEIESSGHHDPTIANTMSQYGAVRDNLVRNAKRANYGTEGIILKLVTGGIDMATIIRFKDPLADNSLAKVNRYQGLYVFTDNTPTKNYEYVGNCKSTDNSFKTQYTSLRDKLIKICQIKYKNANAIVLHLTVGGKDTAEAIRL